MMPSVRISSDWGHANRMDWVGAPAVDKAGHIERTFPIPEEAYQQIEAGIAAGHIEGDAYLPDGSRFYWFLDR